LRKKVLTGTGKRIPLFGDLRGKWADMEKGKGFDLRGWFGTSGKKARRLGKRGQRKLTLPGTQKGGEPVLTGRRWGSLDSYQNETGESKEKDDFQK